MKAKDLYAKSIAYLKAKKEAKRARKIPPKYFLEASRSELRSKKGIKNPI